MSPFIKPIAPEAIARVELATAIDAALLAGQVLREYWERGVESRSKVDQTTYNLVTDADLAAERTIVTRLREAFPDHEVMGEEQAIARADAEHLWIVDPLDGTNNFVHRIPHFAVSIAYYHRGVPQDGVVVNPARNDWYWASRGQGAFHNGARLSVSPADSLDQTLVACGFYYDRGTMMEATLSAIHDFFKAEIHGIRRFGTAALDLCQVAAGLFGAFFEYTLSPWDFAAGQLIVLEAGGRVSDGHGVEPLPLTPTSLLATNSRLHPAALAIVQRHHPPAEV